MRFYIPTMFDPAQSGLLRDDHPHLEQPAQTLEEYWCIQGNLSNVATRRAGSGLPTRPLVRLGAIIPEVPNDLVEDEREPHGAAAGGVDVPAQRGGDFQGVPEIRRQAVQSGENAYFLDMACWSC